jgi:NAD(P)-dependent dehydrogenase (short-subunit alcohol dehydrogenase family)
MRASTPASQACGSTSLSFAVYAARRTMPRRLVFPKIRRDRHAIGSAQFVLCLHFQQRRTGRWLQKSIWAGAGYSGAVVLVAFLEHGLECRQADRHSDDASPVAFLQEGELHWLALEREGEHDDHHGARRSVDEEDRLPTVVLRQVATDCWADRNAPYFAAKAAMDSLAVLYARELSRRGIETTIVVPGAFTKGTNHFAFRASG